MAEITGQETSFKGPYGRAVGAAAMTPVSPKRAAVEPPSPALAREPGPSVSPVTDGPGILDGAAGDTTRIPTVRRAPSSRLLPVSGPPRAAAGAPSPVTGAGRPERQADPGRGRSPSPAGASLKAHGSPPAGSRGLSGAEWRAAAKAAQSKRRQPTRSAAAKPTTGALPLPPVTGGVALTATAHCIGRCDWGAGPGPAAEVDRAAEKHVRTGHPAAVVTEPSAPPGRREPPGDGEPR